MFDRNMQPGQILWSVCYAFYYEWRNILVNIIWFIFSLYDSSNFNIFDWAIKGFTIFLFSRLLLISK